ncbi:sialate O-acetylesterase [Planctomicrobium sp. SH664]|uniref:sialate O-acetylesterase n=1 Tax=Planctomicrobium sp. SH664 TaxID=3448125 RepID=UPI003F5B89BF
MSVRLWRLSLVFVMGVWAGNLAVAAERQTENAAAPQELHLFLLVGQSNMAGRGHVSEEDRVPHPRVLMLNREKQWVPAVDPIHFDKPAAGTGLAKTFAIAYAEAHPGVVVGLIPCAKGGSPISYWNPGVWHEQTKSYPWDECLERARFAQQSGTLKGILWHQGEGDSGPGSSQVYADRLKDLVHRLRAELNAEDVPFVLGELGRFEGRPWDEFRTKVNDIIRDLPNQVSNCACASADGLTANKDLVHFDAESCREFGRRYYAAYEQLTGKPAVGKSVPAGKN